MPAPALPPGSADSTLLEGLLYHLNQKLLSYLPVSARPCIALQHKWGHQLRITLTFLTSSPLPPSSSLGGPEAGITVLD